MPQTVGQQQLLHSLSCLPRPRPDSASPRGAGLGRLAEGPHRLRHFLLGHRRLRRPRPSLRCTLSHHHTLVVDPRGSACGDSCAGGAALHDLCRGGGAGCVGDHVALRLRHDGTPNHRQPSSHDNPWIRAFDRGCASRPNHRHLQASPVRTRVTRFSEPRASARR